MEGNAEFYMKVKVIKQKVEIRKSSRNRSLRWVEGKKKWTAMRHDGILHESKS